MKALAEIRKKVFWAVDFLEGGEIRKHLREVGHGLENYDNNSVEKRKETNLFNLLKHAAKTVPYYSGYAGFKALNEFPVVNKTIIRENQGDFLSADYVGKKLHKAITSGSTGAPFIVFQDHNKRKRHQADNILFLEMAGHNLGARLYYLRVWNAMNRKNLLTQKIQNILTYDIRDLSESSILDLLNRLAHDRNNKSVLGYSSAFEEISRFLNNKSFPVGAIRIRSIMTMSEAISAGAKLNLAKKFGCPVVSRYSNMENGFLAQQCVEENNEFHLNTASYHFETLKEDSDEPALPGAAGRIVVTDLFNYAMPLIRYDTGDMAVISQKSECGKPGPVFTRIEGRKADFIHDTSGNLLSPHIITNTMWKYSSEIRQFQFIQNGQGEYRLKLNCNDKIFSREKELIDDYVSFLGPGARIEIELTDEIPLLASGKRKMVVNNTKT